MSDTSTAEVLPLESSDETKKKDQILDKYKELNEKVEIVLEKINKRKTRKKIVKS